MRRVLGLPAASAMRLVLGLALVPRIVGADPGACTTMSLGRNYSQAEAPTDMSVVRQSVLARLQAEVDALDSVRFSYLGADLDASAVGPRAIDVAVRRVGAEDDVCLRVAYDVTDTDECASRDPAWRHACGPSATCVNTVGGYDCRCPSEHDTRATLNSGAVVHESMPDWGHIA